MNANTNLPIPATRNGPTGFLGWMEEHAEATWPLAILAVAAATDGSLDNAREFLDSGLGEKFGHDVYAAMNGGANAASAIRKTMPRWFRSLHRVHHSELREGDTLYDEQGREVDEVESFSYGLRHSERIVHTRAGYAHATQGGYLLGLSNRKPA